MKHRISTAILLAAIIFSSCTPVETNTPTAIPPIPSFTSTPMIAIPATSTQSVYTQDGKLIEAYQDVRLMNLMNLNRSLGESLIETLWFDESTKWRREDEATARHILELGMNPGLGVRELHTQGITGKGVTLAIIDQPVVLEHPEFQGKIVKYYDVGTNLPPNTGSMHGPAVTSLLVGDSIGTAPDASVYYVAVPSWLGDAKYYADALDWVVEENAKLPKENKIRAVSVSTMPSGIWALLTENQDAWDAAYQRATVASILVLDCTYEQGITVPCTHDLDDPEDVAKCIPNWGGPTDSPHKRINIPTRRTTAIEAGEEGKLVFSYQYTGEGGLSWTVPYLTGVLAMGWQVNPELTNSQILDLLYASSYETNNPAGIIDPKTFIEAVNLTVDE
jgi:serine protease AprX